MNVSMLGAQLLAIGITFEISKHNKWCLVLSAFKRIKHYVDLIFGFRARNN